MKSFGIYRYGNKNTPIYQTVCWPPKNKKLLYAHTEAPACDQLTVIIVLPKNIKKRGKHLKVNAPTCWNLFHFDWMEDVNIYVGPTASQVEPWKK